MLFILKMFKCLYYKIICQNTLNIRQDYYKLLVEYLNNQHNFQKFVKNNVNWSDVEMGDQLLQFYQQNKEDAIKSALIWKSLVANNNQYIRLNYSLQTAELNTLNVIYYFYSVKQKTITRQIYSLYGRSRAMFQNMQHNQPQQKIYNTVKKYGDRIL